MQLAFEPGDDFGVRLWRRFPTLRGVGLGVLLFLGFFALWFSAAFGVWTLSADFSGLGLLLRSVCGVLVRGLFEASVGFSGLGLLLRSVSGVLAGFSGLGLLLWSVSGVLVAGFSGLGLLRSGVGVAVRFEASAGFSGLGTLLRSVLGTVGFSGLGTLLRSVVGTAGFSGLGLFLQSVLGVLVCGFSGVGTLCVCWGLAPAAGLLASFSGVLAFASVATGFSGLVFGVLLVKPAAAGALLLEPSRSAVELEVLWGLSILLLCFCGVVLLCFAGLALLLRFSWPALARGLLADDGVLPRNLNLRFADLQLLLRACSGVVRSALRPRVALEFGVLSTSFSSAAGATPAASFNPAGLLCSTLHARAGVFNSFLTAAGFASLASGAGSFGAASSKAVPVVSHI
eukprot:s3478_g4.t1